MGINSSREKHLKTKSAVWATKRTEFDQDKQLTQSLIDVYSLDEEEETPRNSETCISRTFENRIEISATKFDKERFYKANTHKPISQKNQSVLTASDEALMEEILLGI